MAVFYNAPGTRCLPSPTGLLEARLKRRSPGTFSHMINHPYPRSPERIADVFLEKQETWSSKELSR